LTLAFEKAVNVMYGAIFGMAAAWQTVFAHIPQLLKDAFSMLINPNFWIGIGELLFAGIQSIQGRMTLLFIGVANALANRLADILDNIPFFEDVVEKIRGMSNTGTQAAASVIGQSTAQADKYTQSGLAKISGAVSPVLQEYSTTLSDELSRAISAAQTSKAIDTTGNEDKLQSDITGEAQKAAQAQNNVAQSTAPGTTAPASVVTTTAPSPGTTVSAASTTTTTTPAPPPPASTPSDSRYKLPEADRLTKLGLFTAGSLQMPGLSEAKRTANASEKMAGTLQQVLTHLTLPKGLDAGIQGVNFV